YCLRNLRRDKVYVPADAKEYTNNDINKHSLTHTMRTLVKLLDESNLGDANTSGARAGTILSENKKKQNLFCKKKIHETCALVGVTKEDKITNIVINSGRGPNARGGQIQLQRDHHHQPPKQSEPAPSSTNTATADEKRKLKSNL
uniref:Uncharacterized protein n=1 Tax=Glossina palpalis gambiensis TaxID=67801 RepID=A0A1B0AZ82_9MUSC